jgi:hypothetical protein
VRDMVNRIVNGGGWLDLGHGGDGGRRCVSVCHGHQATGGRRAPKHPVEGTSRPSWGVLGFPSFGGLGGHSPRVTLLRTWASSTDSPQWPGVREPPGWRWPATPWSPPARWR